jgi:hypothetical protein
MVHWRKWCTSTTRRRRSCRRANGDHGPLRWSLLLNHRWHRLCLPLGLHDILRDSFGGWGSLTGAGPGAAPTTASVVAASVAVAAPEEVDLDKKVVRE